MLIVMGPARTAHLVGDDTVGEILLISSAGEQTSDRATIEAILHALKDGATLTLSVQNGKGELHRIVVRKGDNLFL